MTPQASIADLPSLIADLSPDARRRAERMLDVTIAEGETDPPPEMTGWLERQFGSVAAVRRQRIVRVMNRWTLEGSLFSPLRSRRPISGGSHEAFTRLVEATLGDEFCHPESGTPADAWGRVRGRRAITAANAAKYDGRHGVVIFDQHDPLAFDRETIIDLLDVGREWAERSRAEDPSAANYLLIWNCGPRAGGSIVHGHAQVMLGRDPHYAGLERLRQAALSYRDSTGEQLVPDLVSLHHDLQLEVSEADGVAVFTSLTPVKEREVWVVGQSGMDERHPSFAHAVASTVIALRDALGVRAFNLALLRPPIAGEDDAAHARRDGWSLLPPIVRLVDRGDPDTRSSDIGAMELYAASVVGTDPFAVATELRGALASRAIG